MKLLLVLLFILIHFTAFPKEKPNIPDLDSISLAIFQSVQNENPEDYERAKSNLTEEELKQITLEAETEIEDSLLHLIVKVNPHQGYFIEQIPKLLAPLNFKELGEVIFKNNRRRLSPLRVAEKLENQEAFRILSEISNKLNEIARTQGKLSWVKGEFFFLSGISFVFSLNGIVVFLTGGELPGGMAGGVASLIAGGSVAMLLFKKNEKSSNSTGNFNNSIHSFPKENV